jgi:hypothetical protein
MNDNNLPWRNPWASGWNVKNIDVAIYWRLKRLKRLDTTSIIKSRKIPIKLITVLNIIDN